MILLTDLILGMVREAGNCREIGVEDLIPEIQGIVVTPEIIPIEGTIHGIDDRVPTQGTESIRE